MKTRIARYGNSLTVRLPAALARELDFREGDAVAVAGNGKEIVVRKLENARLDAMLSTVKAPERELLTGAAVGAEVLE